MYGSEGSQLAAMRRSDYNGSVMLAPICLCHCWWTGFVFHHSSDTGLETTSRERILWRNLNEHSSLRERAGFGTEAGEEDNAGGTARRLIRRIGGVIKVGKGSQVT